MPEIKKILIIRFSSFGDIVLTYPFISKLKAIYKNAQIDFLTKEKFMLLVKMHNGIDNIIEYKGENIFKLRKILKENKYDIVFDLHKNIRSFFSTLFLNTKKIRYKKGTLKKLLLVGLKINLIKGVIPVYKRYLLALDKIYFLDNLEFTTTDLKFNKDPIIDKSYIFIAPSSKHFTKTFPKEKLELIIERIKNKKIVITGDKSKTDTEICKYLYKKFGNNLEYIENSDFNTLANLIFSSELVICNDSGVLHLSEALNKKVIVFFGSTVKEFGFYPQMGSTIIFENNNLKCRPCTHIGKDKCSKKHFKCMNDINTDEVIKEINENIS